MDDEELLKKRLEELALKAYRNNVFTFTGFLGMGELSTLAGMKNSLSYADTVLFGGMAGCERQMVRFGSEALLGYAEDFPIVCVEAAARGEKFAEELTHRDFLGGLMNLGISRAAIGDIVIRENRGYIFCTDRVAAFVIENLVQIKHTHVGCRIVPPPEEVLEAEAEILRIQVSSVRIDGMIAKVLQCSRSAGAELFRQKKIFLNGRQCENSSRLLSPGDVVTVRGFGRFTYLNDDGITKKGKVNAVIRRN